MKFVFERLHFLKFIPMYFIYFCFCKWSILFQRDDCHICLWVTGRWNIEGMQPNSRLQRIFVLPCALSQTILFREIKFYDLNDFWKLIYERCNINMASPLVPMLLGHWSSHRVRFLWHWSVHWRLRIWLCLRITQENQWKTQLPGPHSRTTGWEDLGARPTNAYFQKKSLQGVLL